MKSAYELAMEKLKARDKEKGVGEDKPVTGKQKSRIAEIRNQATAKLAELEILWKSERAKYFDHPEELEKAERQYVLERKKVEERAQSEIAKIRQGR